jgi:hydrogenase expression/formation protein HypD
MVYSPLDAVEMARRQPATKIVFFAVGFETTAPATALAVRQAAEWGLDNFRLLAAHVRVLPAMVALARQPDCRVEAFLAAGHVCTVTGYHDYQAFVDRYTIPVVVTGFEPVDLLQGILGAVRQLERGEARVENAYPRSVREHGNASARQLVDEIFVPCDAPWRGLGVMPGGGLRMRPQWQRFDASADPGGEATALPVAEDGDSADCRAADVLLGQIKPPACPLFGRECTPDSPRGAPMVSSEGACAAYFRFRAAEVGGGDHGV